jgi:hypothetical protein
VTAGAGGAGGATTAAGGGGGATGRGGAATGGGAAGRGGAPTGGGATGRGGAPTGGGGATTAAGFSTGGGATTGRTGGAGTGGGAGGATTGAGGAATGAGGLATGGGATTGFATTGGGAGRTGGGGAAAVSFFWVIAFSTSPGREMRDKSILVLISSSTRSGRAARADGVCASDEPRMWARTFSASCSSSELECVFFSVTPTSGSASRIALLFTSSSRARSLIRTLLIRPFFLLRVGLMSSFAASRSQLPAPAHDRRSLRVT